MCGWDAQWRTPRGAVGLVRGERLGESRGCRPLPPLSPGGEFSAVVSEKGAAAAAQDPELRARAVREALAATADADRERERRRVRERHQLQKQKRKAAVAEADGLDAQGAASEIFSRPFPTLPRRSREACRQPLTPGLFFP